MDNWTTAASPISDRAVRQLAAMRLLFDADRDRHEADIVLAAVFETLADDHKRTTEELLAQIGADWPGVVFARERLEGILELAAERGFLMREQTFSSTSTWGMTGTAELRVGDSREWANAVLDRCRSQIQDRAQACGVDASFETAQHLANVLLDVLHDAVVASMPTQRFGVREVGGRLFPPYDRGELVRGVERRIDDPETCAFVSNLALAALDPGTTFGSEVVHFLATGYILHALLLGIDLAEYRKEVQDFRGEVLLLDTPVLLRLISNSRQFRGTIDLVGRIARAAGCIVAVTPFTSAEFAMMLSFREGDARRIEREIADGVSRLSLASTTHDEVVATWLSDPEALSWDEFKERARTLVVTLKAVGVRVDYLPSEFQPDSRTSSTFADAVKSVTSGRGRERSHHPAAHDGQLLSVVSFLRRSAKSGEESVDSIWPGAFVMTSDRALDEAYRQVEGQTGVAVSLSISQAAALLARLAQPADAEALAHLVASDVQWRSRFQHATSFGLEEAIEMARALTSSTNQDERAFELTALELTFESLIDQADHAGDPLAAVRAAIVHQEKRTRTAALVHRGEMDAERIRQRERAVRAETEVGVLKRLQIAQAAQIDSLHGATETLRANERDLNRQQRVRDRYWKVSVAYLLAALVLLALVATQVLRWRAAGLPGIAMVATVYGALRWARDPEEPIWMPLLAVIAWVALGVLGATVFG